MKSTMQFNNPGIDRHSQMLSRNLFFIYRRSLGAEKSFGFLIILCIQQQVNIAGRSPHRPLIALRNPLPFYQQGLNPCLSHLRHKASDKIIHRGISALQCDDPLHEWHDLLFRQSHILNMLKSSGYQSNNRLLFSQFVQLIEVNRRKRRKPDALFPETGS